MQFAKEGEVNITLRDITAIGQAQPSENEYVKPEDWEDMEARRDCMVVRMGDWLF